MTISLFRTHSLECVPTKPALRPSIATYFTVWKQRRELASLDVNRLKDLGISPIDATKEAARPIWDL